MASFQLGVAESHTSKQHAQCQHSYMLYQDIINAVFIGQNVMRKVYKLGIK